MTDVNAKIDELEMEEKELKEEIQQVKAALKGYALPYFSQPRSESFQRAGLYAGNWWWWWSGGGLQARLSELTADLTALRNLVLEARRTKSYADVGTTRYFSDERAPQRRLPSGSLIDVPEDEGLVHLPARRPCGAWRLKLVVPKGVQLLHLRKSVFSWAQESCAYYSQSIDYDYNFDAADSGTTSRSIDYVDTTAESDLMADLYFKTETAAENFRTLLDAGIQKRWHGASPPTGSDAVFDPNEQLDSNRRVWERHYDRSLSPNRDGAMTVEMAESLRSDGTTTVITDPQVIAMESWIDPARNHHQFHEFYVDESIKRTAKKDKLIKEGDMDPYPEEDTVGNKIPLPSDWHDLYDKKASTRPMYISFVASHLPVDGPQLDSRHHNGEDYVPLQVDIHFHPDLSTPEITSLLQSAKTPKHVSGRIYQVHIFKREPGMFIRKTTERHAATIATWP